MKNLFYLLMIILISGCSLKQEVTDVNSYSIDFNSKNKSYQNIGKSILIEEPLVNNSFNSRSIFYSTKPYLFEEYAKNRWINLPSSMVHNSLLESFGNSKLFTFITQEKTEQKPFNVKFWVFIGIIVVAAIFVWSTNNQIVDNDENVKTHWSKVINQYQRRADLVP